MSDLLGGPVKRCTDQALVKDPRAGSKSFYHQDSRYWHIGPGKGCNAWIALDEVGPKAIALGILPGTHRIREIIPHEEYFDESGMFRAETNSSGEIKCAYAVAYELES